jgi:hypothetical protein
MGFKTIFKEKSQLGFSFGGKIILQNLQNPAPAKRIELFHSFGIL